MLHDIALYKFTIDIDNIDIDINGLLECRSLEYGKFCGGCFARC